MKRAATLAATLAVLTACAPRPDVRPGEAFAEQSEKRVFVALREVHAGDEQRLAVMRAWDDIQPRLKAVAAEADTVMEQWRALDRRSDDFVQRSNELAFKWGELSAQRVKLTAGYESRVAAALDEEQWQAWQEFWNRPAFGPREGAPPEGGGRMRRRG
jgi:hypothetical protein